MSTWDEWYESPLSTGSWVQHNELGGGANGVIVAISGVSDVYATVHWVQTWGTWEGLENSLGGGWSARQLHGIERPLPVTLEAKEVERWLAKP